MRRVILGAMFVACAPSVPTSSTPPPPRSAPPFVAARSEPAPPPAPADLDDCEPIRIDPPALIRTKIDVRIPPIVHAESLEAFFGRMAALARGRTRDHVRLMMYGDSNLTRDYISGEMRRVLQGRHGDGGHGYVAIGKPWEWYAHMDVEHGLEPKAWRSFAVSTHAAADQRYGFGGIAAQSLSNGARAWVATAGSDAPVGRSASRADLFYLRHPRGRVLRVTVDGELTAEIDTRAETHDLGFSRLSFVDSPHRIVLHAAIGVRLFGVALEREPPSIVVDSIGVGGANVVHLARMRRPIALAALRRRPHHLVLVLTGGTEDDDERHDVALTHIVELHREASPDVACLVMSPPDFAYGSIHAPKPSKRIGRLAERKRALAEKIGCAFWDFRAAMGGEMSIVRFAHLGMAWRDLVHLNEAGGAYMARRFLHALSAALADFVEAHPRAGCEVEPNADGAPSRAPGRTRKNPRKARRDRPASMGEDWDPPETWRRPAK